MSHDTATILGAALGLAIVGTVLIATLINNRLLDNRLVPLPSRDPYMPAKYPPMHERFIEYYNPRTYNTRGKRLLLYTILLQLLVGSELLIFSRLITRNW
jgi:hypothetical protein